MNVGSQLMLDLVFCSCYWLGRDARGGRRGFVSLGSPEGARVVFRGLRALPIGLYGGKEEIDRLWGDCIATAARAYRLGKGAA